MTSQAPADALLRSALWAARRAQGGSRRGPPRSGRGLAAPAGARPKHPRKELHLQGSRNSAPHHLSSPATIIIIRIIIIVILNIGIIITIIVIIIIIIMIRAPFFWLAS